MNAGWARRLHFPEGELPFGRKVRGVCHCGYTTTPRVDGKRARDALLEEHGFTSADDGCAICGWTTEDVQIGDVIAGRRVSAAPPYPIEVYRPLQDPASHLEVWVCRDEGACNDRYTAQQHAVQSPPAQPMAAASGNVLPFRRRASR